MTSQTLTSWVYFRHALTAWRWFQIHEPPNKCSLHFPNDVPACSHCSPPPPPPILFFSCVHVCFYRQEVTSSQLFFSIPPSGCSSYLQPIRLLADLLWLSLLFSSYLSAHMLRKIAFVLGLCWRSGEVEVSLRWGSGRHKAEGRRSKTSAGWTITWILQALHQRDGSYSKIHKEQMVTEKRREEDCCLLRSELAFRVMSNVWTC